MYVGVAQGRSERGKGEGIVKCVCVCECECKVRVSACVCACAIERERERDWNSPVFLKGRKKTSKGDDFSLSLDFISHFSCTVSRSHAHSLFPSFNLSLSIPFSLVVFQILFLCQTSNSLRTSEFGFINKEEEERRNQVT